MKTICTYLISGLLGSGKTTCLRHLIAQKPNHERWALLINEFGEIDIDGAVLEPLTQTDSVILKSVSGGCICCSAQFNLAQALGELSQQNIDKLFIEPTGLGHPAKIVDTLKQFEAFELKHTLCVITPQQLTEVRWHKSQVMRDLVTLADTVLLNKTDLSTVEEIAHSKAIIKKLYSQKALLETQFGKLDIEKLHSKPATRLFSFQNQSQNLSPKTCAINPHGSQNQDWKSTLPGVEQAFLQLDPQTQQIVAIGWQFSPQVQFNRVALKKWMTEFAPQLNRAKGLIRTGKEWQLLNYIDNDLQLEEFAWRKDSRLECIFSDLNDPEAEQAVAKNTIFSMESQLLSVISLR